MVDVSTYWRGRLGSKLIEVAIDWKPMESCAVRHGAGCDDGLRQLVISNRNNTA